MMSLKEWSLAHKINEPTSELITFTISLQVPIRRVPVISTVWSATITALTPTKLWLTAGSIRSWTASWLLASRSSPRPSTAPSTAAVTPGSRPITTAGNVSTLSWACLRWKPTSTDTWTSSWAGAGPGRPSTVSLLGRQWGGRSPPSISLNVRTRPTRPADVGNWGVWQSQLASRNSI